MIKWIAILAACLGLCQMAHGECVNCGDAPRVTHSNGSSGGYGTQTRERRGLFGFRRVSHGSSGGQGSSGGVAAHRVTCPNCSTTFDCNEVGAKACACCENCTGKAGCACGCPECKCNTPVDKAPPAAKVKTEAPESLASRAPEIALDGGLTAGR